MKNNNGVLWLLVALFFPLALVPVFGFAILILAVLGVIVFVVVSIMEKIEEPIRERKKQEEEKERELEEINEYKKKKRIEDEKNDEIARMHNEVVKNKMTEFVEQFDSKANMLLENGDYQKLILLVNSFFIKEEQALGSYLRMQKENHDIHSKLFKDNGAIVLNLLNLGNFKKTKEFNYWGTPPPYGISDERTYKFALEIIAELVAFASVAFEKGTYYGILYFGDYHNIDERETEFKSLKQLAEEFMNTNYYWSNNTGIIFNQIEDKENIDNFCEKHVPECILIDFAEDIDKDNYYSLCLNTNKQKEKLLNQIIEKAKEKRQKWEIWYDNMIMDSFELYETVFLNDEIDKGKEFYYKHFNLELFEYDFSSLSNEEEEFSYKKEGLNLFYDSYDYNNYYDPLVNCLSPIDPRDVSESDLNKFKNLEVELIDLANNYEVSFELLEQ